MQKVLVGLMVVLLMYPAISMAKKKKDIVGTYTITGFNPGVSTSGDPSYKGILEITPTNGAYHLVWKATPAEKKVYEGVGIYNDGVLSAGYAERVVSYKVDGNEMKGVWSSIKGGNFGYEFCKRKE